MEVRLSGTFAGRDRKNAKLKDKIVLFESKHI